MGRAQQAWLTFAQQCLGPHVGWTARDRNPPAQGLHLNNCFLGWVDIKVPLRDLGTVTLSESEFLNHSSEKDGGCMTLGGLTLEGL